MWLTITFVTENKAMHMDINSDDLPYIIGVIMMLILMEKFIEIELFDKHT